MARSSLEKKIKDIEIEIEEIKHELDTQRRQFELLRHEALSIHSLIFTPKLPSKSTTVKSKKKPTDIRISLLKSSPKVREYEYLKKRASEEKLLEEERRRIELERIEFETIKKRRLEELEELGEITNNAIRTLERTLAELVEEYERLSASGPKPYFGRSRKLSKKNRKHRKL